MPRSSSPVSRWASPGPHRVVTAEVGAWSTADGRSVAVLARYPGACTAQAIFEHEHRERAA
ncbi:MAG: hypothetical protein ACRDOI_36860 [Trebonia sp.]